MICPAKVRRSTVAAHSRVVPDAVRPVTHAPPVVGVIPGFEQLVELLDRVHDRHRDAVGAAKPAALTLHAAPSRGCPHGPGGSRTRRSPRATGTPPSGRTRPGSDRVGRWAQIRPSRRTRNAGPGGASSSRHNQPGVSASGAKSDRHDNEDSTVGWGQTRPSPRGQLRLSRPSVRVRVLFRRSHRFLDVLQCCLGVSCRMRRRPQSAARR